MFILVIYGVMFFGGMIILGIKVIERKREKKNENLDKYDKF